MNAENSMENPVRQDIDLTFFFPNESEEADVISTMQRIIDYRFEGGVINSDKISEMGTIWLVEASIISEKSRKPIEEMTEEELVLELLSEEHLPEEF